MRHDCLRAATITVRPLGFRCHREGVARACHLSGRVGNTRFGSALVHMLIKAARVLRHAGHCQEWRDECYCEDVFHGHNFSPSLIEALGQPNHWPSRNIRRTRIPTVCCPIKSKSQKSLRIMMQINGSVTLIELLPPLSVLGHKRPSAASGRSLLPLRRSGHSITAHYAK